MKNVIVITGASSGFGALTARALAQAGHTVYAGMRETQGRNRPNVQEAQRFATEYGVDLHTVELDVQSVASCDVAIAHILERDKKLDVVVHNAGHMMFGPAEAFSPEQFAELYDINVLGTQRLNRVVLPLLRKQGKGLLVWVSSSSARGGTPPYVAPYFAAKAALDSLAISYSGELARWGVETSIVVPGSFTKGTKHYAHAGAPEDLARADEYANGPYKGLPDVIMKGMIALEPADADANSVAAAIVGIVGSPHGKRPMRGHVDPSRDGCEVVNGVADRVREELLRRVGLDDLLNVRIGG
jgi:NAD(P)-dependent dehydrogenase (short-subunit alcohol dehydrogenase family)